MIIGSTPKWCTQKSDVHIMCTQYTLFWMGHAWWVLLLLVLVVVVVVLLIHQNNSFKSATWLKRKPFKLQWHNNTRLVSRIHKLWQRVLNTWNHSCACCCVTWSMILQQKVWHHSRKCFTCSFQSICHQKSVLMWNSHFCCPLLVIVLCISSYLSQLQFRLFCVYSIGLIPGHDARNCPADQAPLGL